MAIPTRRRRQTNVKTCAFCGARLAASEHRKRLVERRWIAIIAAIFGALVTTLSENVLLGQNLARAIEWALS